MKDKMLLSNSDKSWKLVEEINTKFHNWLADFEETDKLVKIIHDLNPGKINEEYWYKVSKYLSDMKGAAFMGGMIIHDCRDYIK